MAPLRINLQLIGLTLLFAVSSVVALKCYNCDSASNPDCGEITKNTKLQAEECTPAMAAYDNGNWIRALIRITYFSDAANPTPVDMVCQTILGKRGDNITTVRTCQFNAANTNQCEVAKQQLREKQIPDAEIISCSVCSQDLCNAATGQIHWRTTLILVGATWAFNVMLNRFKGYY